MAFSGIRIRHPERNRGICTFAGCRTLVAALALPVLAAACVTAEDALAPKVPPTLDAALADVAHPALDVASKWFSGAGVLTPEIVPSRCPFESASRFFVCAPLTAGDLTLSQRFTLLDASGGKQPAFDAATTTGLHLENAVTGTYNSLNVDGQQVLDLTGLGTSRHTLNGASLTLSGPLTTGGGTTTERRTTITDLVFPVVAAGAPQSWPLSGTVDVRARSVSVAGDTTIFIATMRFDGSSLVTLTYTVPGGIQTCRVDITSMPPGGVGCMGPSTPPIGRETMFLARPTLR